VKNCGHRVFPDFFKIFPGNFLKISKGRDRKILSGNFPGINFKKSGLIENFFPEFSRES